MFSQESWSEPAPRDQDVEARGARLRDELSFARLCNTTDRIAKEMRESVLSFSAAVRTENSANVAESLKWDAR